MPKEQKEQSIGQMASQLGVDQETARRLGRPGMAIQLDARSGGDEAKEKETNSFASGAGAKDSTHQG